MGLVERAMTATLAKLTAILNTMGSDVTFHREDGGTPCPCRTPEGFRDPAWHRANPSEPVCNELGLLAPVVVNFIVKASVQPAAYGYRRVNQRAEELLGEVEKDDKLGIFPCVWNGNPVSFEDWSDGGEDYVIYDGERYFAAGADKVPDIDGDPNHHWEVGLRLIKIGRPT
jgi:hypothetical protein